ncbi:tetratricopeptide repeat protein [Terriglobus saanensis]|nr:tetratricopeptide repeat protein [Terriglobus saanensis]
MTARRTSKTGRLVRQNHSAFLSLSTAWITAILAFTFLAYLPVLRFAYVFDDVEQIVKNPHIQSWQYLSDYFTQSLWSHGGAFQTRFYRPFFLLWLRLNNALFGLNPFYWHLTTLVSHVCATFVLYLLVRQVSRNWLPAIFSALLFGLHPIHIQVAAWISSVSESLLAASLLASLLCYMLSVSRKDKRWLTASLALYTAALLLKETAVGLPAIVFLYVWLWNDPQSKDTRARFAFARTLPFLAVTAVYLCVRAVVLHTVVAQSSPMRASTLFFTLPSILLAYFKLFLWPTRLSPMYPSVLLTRLEAKAFLFPLLGWVALAVGAVFLIWRDSKRTGLSSADKDDQRLLPLSLLWAAIFLLPALYLPALQEGAFIQDRYLYLPSAGLAIVVGLAIARVGSEGRKFLGMPRVQIVIAATLAVIMAFGIRREIYVWADNISLFTRAVERSPGNKIAQHDLAAGLLDAKRYEDAIPLLQKLLREEPNDPVGNNNLGQAYLNLGDRIHAEGYLAKSCQIHPTARQLYQLGAVRFNLGRADAAEQTFRQAIAMDPNGLGYHSGLGLALERLGKQNLAKEAFEQEVTVNPQDTISRQAIARLSTGGL